MKTSVTIQFFPTGEMVEYEIRPGVWIPCVVMGRAEKLGRYQCRHLGEDGISPKVSLIDSHNLREIAPQPHVCEICAGPNPDHINGQVCPECVQHARENR